MADNNKLKKSVFLVGKKAVKVLERYPHTMKVQFIKSGKIISVKNEYVIRFTPKEPVKKEDKNQTKLF